MSFKFKQASCVVVGTFNIYVFQPPFFVQTGLVEVGQLAKFEQDLSQPGFKVTFPSQIQWLVRPDRIATTTSVPTDDCGGHLAKILDSLPWTPIRALGINFEFQTSLDDFAQMPLSQIVESIAKQDILQKTIHVGIEEPPHVLNLQISRTAEAVELSCNFHTEISEANSKKKERLEQSKFAADICRRFGEFRLRTITLSQDVFGIEVNYANDSQA